MAAAGSRPHQPRNGAGRSRQVSRLRASGHDGGVDDLSRLKKARSLLLLLLATCKETQLALGAVANVLDTQLSTDLDAMIERSEGELRELNAKIDGLSAK
jgi:hypothetical protein